MRMLYFPQLPSGSLNYWVFASVECTEGKKAPLFIKIFLGPRFYKLEPTNGNFAQ